MISVVLRVKPAAFRRRLSHIFRSRFTFDECFDSFGPSDEDFAGQERVFEALAPPLIRSAMDGYNITVFAYGQTASGKRWVHMGAH